MLETNINPLINEILHERARQGFVPANAQERLAQIGELRELKELLQEYLETHELTAANRGEYEDNETLLTAVCNNLELNEEYSTLYDLLQNVQTQIDNLKACQDVTALATNSANTLNTIDQFLAAFNDADADNKEDFLEYQNDVIEIRESVQELQARIAIREGFQNGEERQIAGIPDPTDYDVLLDNAYERVIQKSEEVDFNDESLRNNTENIVFDNHAIDIVKELLLLCEKYMEIYTRSPYAGDFVCDYGQKASKVSEIKAKGKLVIEGSQNEIRTSIQEHIEQEYEIILDTPELRGHINNYITTVQHFASNCINSLESIEQTIFIGQLEADQINQQKFKVQDFLAFIPLLPGATQFNQLRSLLDKCITAGQAFSGFLTKALSSSVVSFAEFKKGLLDSFAEMHNRSRIQDEITKSLYILKDALPPEEFTNVLIQDAIDSLLKFTEKPILEIRQGILNSWIKSTADSGDDDTEAGYIFMSFNIFGTPYLNTAYIDDVPNPDGVKRALSENYAPNKPLYDLPLVKVIEGVGSETMNFKVRLDSNSILGSRGDIERFNTFKDNFPNVLTIPKIQDLSSE